MTNDESGKRPDKGRKVPEIPKDDAAYWVRDVVAPAFEQFAVFVGAWGLDPVINCSGRGCRVVIWSRGRADRRFEASVGLLGEQTERVDARCPGSEAALSGMRRRDVDTAMIREALRRSFSHWIGFELA